MFHQNVDEQLICEVSGHCSNAVRRYKKTSDNLHRQISSVIQGHYINECKGKDDQAQGSDMSDFEIPNKPL